MVPTRISEIRPPAIPPDTAARFLEVAPGFPVLARSRYRAIAASYVESDRGLYPGSALLAMTMLGDTTSYLLCDLDRESFIDLRRWSREFGLHNCEVAEADGMAAVAARLDSETRRPGLVHIDPFDRHARAPGGYSALELAARVADSGTGLVYWYGYEEPGAQGRAHKQLAALTRAPLWCGEVTVTGANESLGDLDHSATLCTFGIILANVREDTAGMPTPYFRTAPRGISTSQAVRATGTASSPRASPTVALEQAG